MSLQETPLKVAKSVVDLELFFKVPYFNNYFEKYHFVRIIFLNDRKKLKSPLFNA